MAYAQVTDSTITTVSGRLPNSARRLDTGQWVMGLANAPTADVQACGWFEVVRTTEPDPTDSTFYVVRSVELVDGVPTETWTQTAKTQEQIDAETAAAADEAERDAARQAFDNLQAYRDLQSPTGAQTVAVVKLLCRIVQRLIRDQYGR